MSKIIGLDISSNSIGWAIVDRERGKVINMGCKVFADSIEERIIEGRIVQKKSTGIGKLVLKNLNSVSKFMQRNLIVSLFFFLQIITLFLLLTNLHNWQFWFNLSFTVLVALLSIIYRR